MGGSLQTCLPNENGKQNRKEFFNHETYIKTFTNYTIIIACELEIRERGGKIIQILTGCKAADACKNNMNNNFLEENPDITQCRPEVNLKKNRFWIRLSDIKS